MIAIACNDANFESEALQAEVPVLVDFWAPWCGPCKALSPIVDEIAREYDGRLKVLKASENVTVQVVTIKGKSGCAGCDHGVVPIGSPDELGLAVNAGDGNVYVIEDAHKRYPNVYEHRFERLPLKVVGKVLNRHGKITWIQPAQLKVLN